MECVMAVRKLEMLGMQVQVFSDKVRLGRAAVAMVAETLRQAIAQRGEASIILATGASSMEVRSANFRPNLPSLWEPGAHCV